MCKHTDLEKSAWLISLKYSSKLDKMPLGTNTDKFKHHKLQIKNRILWINTNK